MNQGNSIASSAQSSRGQVFVARLNATKVLPLFHNATEGSIRPNRYNSVLWEHLEFVNAGDILSWKGLRRGVFKMIKWATKGEEEKQIVYPYFQT